MISAEALCRTLPFSGTSQNQGLPRGALVEISGAPGCGKTEVLLQFLAENPKLRIAWIESDFTIYPCAFPEHRVGLERILFVEPADDDSFWIAQQIMRSRVFEIIVIAEGRERTSENTLRRLQLLAQKAQVTVILLNSSSLIQRSWPIAVQLQVRRTGVGGSPRIEILKWKGQRA